MSRQYDDVIKYTKLRMNMSDSELVKENIFTRQELYRIKSLARDIGYSTRTFKSTLLNTLLEYGILSCYPVICTILGNFAFLALILLCIAICMSLYVLGTCVFRIAYFKNVGVSEDLLFIIGYISISLSDFEKSFH